MVAAPHPVVVGQVAHGTHGRYRHLTIEKVLLRHAHELFGPENGTVKRNGRNGQRTLRSIRGKTIIVRRLRPRDAREGERRARGGKGGCSYQRRVHRVDARKKFSLQSLGPALAQPRPGPASRWGRAARRGRQQRAVDTRRPYTRTWRPMSSATCKWRR